MHSSTGVKEKAPGRKKGCAYLELHSTWKVQVCKKGFAYLNIGVIFNIAKKSERSW